MTPDENTLDLIKKNLPFMKKRELQAANYILEHPQEIIHKSITEVAAEADVSETTIFRLANRLGYSGFYQFKVALISSITDPIKNIHSQIIETDDQNTVMQKLIKGYQESLLKTLELNRDNSFELAVEHMLRADNVYFFGSAGSFSLALDAYHKFVRVGITGNASCDPHWMSMYETMSKVNDVFILLSSSGRNKELISFAEIARKNNRFIVLITANQNTILSQYADIVLLAHGREYSYRSEAMESRFSMLFLIDTLYVLLALHDTQSKEKTLKKIKSIRRGISQHRV